jgi:hypothetical protein
MRSVVKVFFFQSNKSHKSHKSWFRQYSATNPSSDNILPMQTLPKGAVFLNAFFQSYKSHKSHKSWFRQYSSINPVQTIRYNATYANIVNKRIVQTISWFALGIKKPALFIVQARKLNRDFSSIYSKITASIF